MKLFGSTSLVVLAAVAVTAQNVTEEPVNVGGLVNTTDGPFIPTTPPDLMNDTIVVDTFADSTLCPGEAAYIECLEPYSEISCEISVDQYSTYNYTWGADAPNGGSLLYLDCAEFSPENCFILCPMDCVCMTESGAPCDASVCSAGVGVVNGTDLPTRGGLTNTTDGPFIATTPPYLMNDTTTTTTTGEDDPSTPPAEEGDTSTSPPEEGTRDVPTTDSSAFAVSKMAMACVAVLSVLVLSL